MIGESITPMRGGGDERQQPSTPQADTRRMSGTRSVVQPETRLSGSSLYAYTASSNTSTVTQQLNETRDGDRFQNNMNNYIFARKRGLHQQEHHSNRDPKVAEKEEKAVNRSKILLFLVLAIAIVGVSTFVFFFLSRYEKKEFKSKFENFATQLFTVAKENALNTMDAIESFSVGITSHSNQMNQEWPYVFIPDFPEKASRLLGMSDAVRTSFAPIIERDDQMEGWIDFTKENMDKVYTDAVNFNDSNTTVYDLMEITKPYVFSRHKPEDGPPPWAPIWEWYPSQTRLPDSSLMNFNLLSDLAINETFQSVLATKAPALIFKPINSIDIDGRLQQTTFFGSYIIQPIFSHVKDYNNANKTQEKEKKVVGVLMVVINWLEYFQNLPLPENADGIDVVLESTCPGVDNAVRYNIYGMKATLAGRGDDHDRTYDNLGMHETFVNLTHDGENLSPGSCDVDLKLHIYPTSELEDSIRTSKPIFYTLAALAIFGFTIAVFVVFDLSVRRRQHKMMDHVKLQDQIVSNLFPSNFRDKLYGVGPMKVVGGPSSCSVSSRGGLIEMMKNSGADFDDTVNGGDIFGSAPLAELYVSVSVIFADISGFTAWASAREPTQVFQLLERIYSSFDHAAYRTGVFKIETVGDCYVACAGLPEVTEDHAVAAAKFARSILNDWDGLTRKLEVMMGPDTTELKLRIGIHTGQVTAGVLRGDKSRFQLFGDTVNVASRMENTSELSRIQLSGTSASMLRELGYGRWISQRKELVALKGKGDMQTYWLETKAETMKRKVSQRRKRRRGSNGSSVGGNGNEELTSLTQCSSKEDIDDGHDDTIFSDILDDEDENDEFVQNMSKKERLVRWNLEKLTQLLEQICAARICAGRNHNDRSHVINTISRKRSLSFAPSNSKDGNITVMRKQELELMEKKRNSTVLEEFKEIIPLPQISAKDLKIRRKRALQSQYYHQLDDNVKSELYNFLMAIADEYHDGNAFHNFEHASHVTASVCKLLSRIVNVDESDDDIFPEEKLVCHSYGITSDPLTQFAVVFSAFIHDVDHPGVPNTQLVKEKTHNARYYKEKSVAEQNSVDIAWNLLMREEYANLRSCIYSNKKELHQFRQLVVNVVMATDICDKELGSLRKARWAAAFSEDDNNKDSKHNSSSSNSPSISINSRNKTHEGEEDMNRKATIVLEHLIQASDVAHTMQHWHVYRTWNERLFQEMYEAYRAGRADTDPSLNWYDSEIGFFDFYIIPLAKKLDSCGVFGLSSHEYLNYATSNREEWVRRGKGIISEYLSSFQRQQRRNSNSSMRCLSVSSQHSPRKDPDKDDHCFA